MAGEYISDEVYDQGLDWATTNGTQIDITSQVATTITEAITTYTLGDDTITTSAAQAGAVSGRRVITDAITTGSVTGTDTATHWALSNGTDTLVATGPLTAGQAVTSGNTFTLDAISITVLDATVT